MQGRSTMVIVMAGLDPAIHVLGHWPYEVAWIPGSSPGMTSSDVRGANMLEEG